MSQYVNRRSVKPSSYRLIGENGELTPVASNAAVYIIAALVGVVVVAAVLIPVFLFANQAQTPSPTSAPSTSPTTSPTTSPSRAPTSSPTTNPTTLSPTTSPTTLSPTTSPTTLPTTSPTIAPTSGPTISPTVAPTFPITSAPTVSPTISPLDGCGALCFLGSGQNYFNFGACMGYYLSCEQDPFGECINLCYNNFVFNIPVIQPTCGNNLQWQGLFQCMCIQGNLECMSGFCNNNLCPGVTAAPSITPTSAPTIQPTTAGQTFSPTTLAPSTLAPSTLAPTIMPTASPTLVLAAYGGRYNNGVFYATTSNVNATTWISNNVNLNNCIIARTSFINTLEYVFEFKQWVMTLFGSFSLVSTSTYPFCTSPDGGITYNGVTVGLGSSNIPPNTNGGDVYFSNYWKIILTMSYFTSGGIGGRIAAYNILNQDFIGAVIPYPGTWANISGLSSAIVGCGGVLEDVCFFTGGPSRNSSVSIFYITKTSPIPLPYSSTGLSFRFVNGIACNSSICVFVGASTSFTISCLYVRVDPFDPGINPTNCGWLNVSETLSTGSAIAFNHALSPSSRRWVMVGNSTNNPSAIISIFYTPNLGDMRMKGATTSFVQLSVNMIVYSPLLLTTGGWLISSIDDNTTNAFKGVATSPDGITWSSITQTGVSPYGTVSSLGAYKENGFGRRIEN